MTPVEDRLRDLRAATRSEIQRSPELLARIRHATDHPRQLRDRLARLAKPSTLPRRPKAPPRGTLAILAVSAAAAAVILLAVVLAGRAATPAATPKGSSASRPRAAAGNPPRATALAPLPLPSSLIYQYADADPGARHVTLISADGKIQVPVVVLPDGALVLGRGDLPELAKFQTYQLWGIVGDQEISLGVAGANPDFVSFTAPRGVTVLFMTVEDEGGVVTPTTVPVVSGLVNSPGFDGSPGDWLRNGGVRSRVV